MLQERLLDVAIDHFGRFGFDGAATRLMAREADTAMSSITYHFGGKQGLYLACAEHIGHQIAERLAPLFEAIGDPGAHNREQAAEALLSIVGGFVPMMIDPRSASWARFIVREQQEPTEAFERLWSTAMGQVLAVASQLMARIAPHLDECRRQARVVLIFGQVLILRQARASVCRAMGVAELGDAEAKLLSQQVQETTRAILMSGD